MNWVGGWGMWSNRGFIEDGAVNPGMMVCGLILPLAIP